MGRGNFKDVSLKKRSCAVFSYYSLCSSPNYFFQYLVTCLVQFRMLLSKNIGTENIVNDEESTRLLKLLITGLMTLFSAKELAQVVSKSVLKDVISFLLTCLVEDKFQVFEDSDQAVKTINMLILKMIHNTDHNRCFG